MPKRVILGVHVTDRVREVPDVQRVLTEYGCCIKTRLGLHDVSDAACAPSGLLILELHCTDEKMSQVQAKLAAIPGVSVQKMVFGE